MKCKPLRRRYVIFACEAPVDDYSAVSAIYRELERQAATEAAPAGARTEPGPAAGEGRARRQAGGPVPGHRDRIKIKVICRSGPLLLVRTDQLALKQMLKAGGEMRLRCGPGELRSLAAVGSVKKGKEKIKACLASIEVGMKRPSQSIQNSKDVEHLTD